MAELLFRDRARCVNFVAEHKERYLRELFDGEKRVELSLRLYEPLVVRSVNKEDDSVDFWEVVAPQAAGCTTRDLGKLDV